jgi:hypothetical protein
MIPLEAFRPEKAWPVTPGLSGHNVCRRQIPASGVQRGTRLHLEDDDCPYYLFDSVSIWLSSLSRIALLLYLVGAAALQPSTLAERRAPLREPDAAFADARDHLAPARTAEALELFRALRRATTLPDARRLIGGQPDLSRATFLVWSDRRASRVVADADATPPPPLGNRSPYDATAPPTLS